MDLTFTDDQRLLQESAERLTADVYSFERRSAILASEEGFSRELWREFADLGWLALPLPESAGGLGGSAVDTGILMEAFGKSIVVEPFLSTILLGAELVARAGTGAQRDALLPEIIAGRTLLAFAHSEKATRTDPGAVAARATRQGDRWVLTGEKVMALGGPSADWFIVSARVEDGVGLFLVPGKDAAPARTDFLLIDGQRASNLSLNGIPVGEDALLGGTADPAAVVSEVLDRAIVAAAAAAAGSMQALLARTADYLKTRIQFGKPLAANQALRHRVADMALRCEEAKAGALRSALMIDGTGSATERMLAASAAKVKVATAGRFVGEQSVQLHGGMGVTEELDIGSYLRSLVTFDLLFGSVDHHRSRYATLRQSQRAAA